MEDGRAKKSRVSTCDVDVLDDVEDVVTVDLAFPLGLEDVGSIRL